MQFDACLIAFVDINTDARTLNIARTLVKNNKSVCIIALGETEDIEITNVVFSHKPFKQNKKGIVQWQLNMKPKENTQITFSFTVNVPKGKDLAFFRTGQAPAQYLQNLQIQKQDKSRNQEDIFEEFKKESNAPAMKKR